MNNSNPIKTRITRTYLAFAAAVFTLTAAGKLFSDFSDPDLNQLDPFLTFLSAKQLMIIVALVELAVASLILRRFLSAPQKGVPIVLWMCSVFALYRLGFHFAPEKAGTCRCFGVGSILGRMEPAADLISIALLSVLLIVGVTIMGITRWATWSNQKPKLSGAAVFTLTLFGLTSSIHSQNQFTPIYSAEGLVEEHVYNNRGTIVSSNTFPFKVMIDDTGNWQINWVMHWPQWAMTSTEYIAYNGTDIYSIIYGDKKLGPDMQPVSILPLEKHEHPARVSKGPFPLDYSSCVGLLWTAFVGGQFVAQNPTAQVPNLLLSRARIDPEAWLTDFRYSQLPEASFPILQSASNILNKTKISLDFLDYPEMDEPDLAEQVEAKLQQLKGLKTTSDAELLRSSYSLEDYKIIKNVQVPLRFTAAKHSHSGAPMPPYTSVKWTAQVTNIVVGNIGAKALLPVLVGKTTVEDRRFKQRTTSGYLNNWFYSLDASGWILSTDDKRFDGRRPEGLNPRPSTKPRRVIFYSVVVAFIVILGWPLLTWARRKQILSSSTRQ